jgi:hemin uptake protein HemP
MTPQEPEPPRPAEPNRPHRPAVKSEELFGGAQEIVIVHGGEQYRLRVTKSGKLILTK